MASVNCHPEGIHTHLGHKSQTRPLRVAPFSGWVLGWVSGEGSGGVVCSCHSLFLTVGV